MNKLTANRLRPNLDILMKRLRDQSEDLKKERDTYLLLEFLPYSVNCMSTAFTSFFSIARNCIDDELSRAKPENKKIQTISLNDDDKLSLYIDIFLNKARCAQNSISPYLSKSLSESVPKSLNDIITNMTNRKLKLPDKIQDIIFKYWESHGRRVKDYRDLSEHIAIVSSDPRITILPSGKVLFYLCLPDNPNISKICDLTYSEPYVHVTNFVIEEFKVLIDFLNNIINGLLGEKNENRLHYIFFMPKGPFKSNEIVGCEFPPENEIMKQLSIDN